MFIFKTLLLFTIALCSTDGYKILALFPIPTGSHYILASKLFKELAKKGHEVTFITPYAEKEPTDNLKVIPMETLQTLFQARGPSMFDRENTTVLEKSKFLFEIQYDFVKHLLSHDKMQNILKSNEHYDAVIVYQYLNEALHGVAHHLKAPLILFSSMPMYAPESFLLSHPSPPSYVPNILSEYTGRMNFWQRLKNSFYDVSMILYYQWFFLPKQRQLVYEYIGNYDLYDFLNNASLALINSHVSTNEAVPLVPNAVEIGGYHIEEPKPLPQHLQKFLDESDNGVVLFSMGSISRSCDFPKDKLDALIRTFAKLKQNVLFKWETDDPPQLSKNVMTMKWIPQSDVLAHPNVKVFISHGGLLSTMESVYHAVPIVGIPVFADQKMNMALARSYEYAVEVPYKELTEEKLSRALDQVLNDPKFRDNIKKRSKIMRDRPIKPLDNALYWIEYVIRHQGAPHLRYAGMDLNWYQRNLLDVGFIVTLAVLTILTTIYILTKIVVRIVSGLAFWITIYIFKDIFRSCRRTKTKRE